MNKTQPLSVSIIILTWNGKDILRDNLPSVSKACIKYPGKTEIIVLDNGSTDGTAEFLKQEYPGIVLLRFEKNLGFGKRYNQGIKASKGDIVITLNNDMKVDEDFISPLVGAFSVRDDVFGVSPQIFPLNSHSFREESGWTNIWASKGWMLVGHILDQDIIDSQDEYRFAFYAGGGASAFHRKRFLEIMFDPIFEPFYFEDLDVSYQAWKRGYVVLFAKNSIVYHGSRTTSRKRFGENQVFDMMKKNLMFLFTWKNISDPDILIGHLISLPYILKSLAANYGMSGIMLFVSALFRLPRVVISRIKSRRHYKLKDKDIFDIFNAYGHRPRLRSFNFNTHREIPEESYDRMVKEELKQFGETIAYNEGNQVNAPGFEYIMSNRFEEKVRKTLGCGPMEFSAKFVNGRKHTRILSLGSGHCGTEINMAKQFNKPYSFTCVDLNYETLKRGRDLAKRSGIDLKIRQIDLNKGTLKGKYDLIIAHASIHHIIKIERLFAQISNVMSNDARFFILEPVPANGMLVRNECKPVIEAIFNILPERYRIDRNGKVRDKFPYPGRHPDYFECIRSDEILPALYAFFDIEHLVKATAFIRRLVENWELRDFPVETQEDRDILDAIFAIDDELVESGKLKPEIILAIAKKRAQQRS